MRDNQTRSGLLQFVKYDIYLLPNYTSGMLQTQLLRYQTRLILIALSSKVRQIQTRKYTQEIHILINYFSENILRKHSSKNVLKREYVKWRIKKGLFDCTLKCCLAMEKKHKRLFVVPIGYPSQRTSQRDVWKIQECLIRMVEKLNSLKLKRHSHEERRKDRSFLRTVTIGRA